MNNPKFLERILEIYKFSSADRLKNDYLLSEHWREYYENQYSKFSKSENVLNFRNKQLLSLGCDDSDRYASFLDLYSFINDWKLDQDFLVKNLSKLNVGNNDTAHKFLGFYLDYAELVHIKLFSHMNSKIKKNINLICEIGGGFGSLGRILINNLNCKYILIDLPEANLISSYFLKSHFSDKKFYLYDSLKNQNDTSSKIDEKCIEENDIFILPPWTLVSFSEKIKINFFVNTYSFMEMRQNIIKNYFDFIHKHSESGSYFLNINRYQKDTSGESIKFSEFPYDDDWDCLISERSPIRHNMHFMLTERKQLDFNKNIKPELKKLQGEEKKSYRSKEYLEFANIPILGSIEKLVRKIFRKLLIKMFGIKFLNKIGKKLYNINSKNK